MNSIFFFLLCSVCGLFAAGGGISGGGGAAGTVTNLAGGTGIVVTPGDPIVITASNIPTNAMSQAAHETYVNTGLATTAALNVVSNQNLRSFSGMQLANANLALSFDSAAKDSSYRIVTLPTNALHGLLYVPANQTTRTTNYLFGISRVDGTGYFYRLDADRMTNLVTTALTIGDYPSAVVRIGDTIYANPRATGDSQQSIVAINILTLAQTSLVTNSTTGSGDGGLATDGTNLFLCGNNTSGYVAKYSTSGILLAETNTYGGSINGPPHAGKNLHTALWDGEFVWAASYRDKSGVIKLNPGTMGFDRFDFDTNHWAFTNFYATDDIADSRDYVWIPGESGNGIVARVSKTTGASVPVASGAGASGYGAFNDGRHIWLLYPFDVQSQGTNDGLAVRLDPDSLRVDWFSARSWINEIVSDGQTLYAGTFAGTNSFLIRNPLGEHLLTAQANTNGTWDWSFNRRTGQLTVGGQVLTNTPATTLPAGIVTNNSTALSLTLANQSFTTTTDTNTLQSYGAGTAGANSYFWYNSVTGSWTNTVAARFWTNFGDGTCRFFSAGVERYVVTNSLPIGDAVKSAGGSEPPPSLRFPWVVVLNGSLSITNGISVTSPVLLDGTNNFIGSLTNTSGGTYQSYIAGSNRLFNTHITTNLVTTSLTWDGTASGANLSVRGTYAGNASGLTNVPHLIWEASYTNTATHFTNAAATGYTVVSNLWTATPGGMAGWQVVSNGTFIQYTNAQPVHLHTATTLSYEANTAGAGTDSYTFAMATNAPGGSPVAIEAGRVRDTAAGNAVEATAMHTFIPVTQNMLVSLVVKSVAGTAVEIYTANFVSMSLK